MNNIYQNERVYAVPNIAAKERIAIIGSGNWYALLRMIAINPRVKAIIVFAFKHIDHAIILSVRRGSAIARLVGANAARLDCFETQVNVSSSLLLLIFICFNVLSEDLILVYTAFHLQILPADVGIRGGH